MIFDFRVGRGSKKARPTIECYRVKIVGHGRLVGQKCLKNIKCHSYRLLLESEGLQRIP